MSTPRSLLESGLTELGIEVSSTTVDGLLRLTELVETWNQQINLTGHRTQNEIIVRLVLDALALGRCLLDPLDSLVDLGSGAGFPGLPLAITQPHTRVVLVESRERRHHFQRTVLRSLGLQNARAIRGRIEALEPEPAQVVIAQAVAPPSEVLESMLPWVEPGGFAVIPGGEAAPDPAAHASIESVDTRRYQTPCGGPRRTLWIGKRR